MLTAFRPTYVCFRTKVRVTIPKLSPTHTKARIYKWCINPKPTTSGTATTKQRVECYDPIFVLQASSDMITEGYRISKNHKPLMIIEAHDEGYLQLDGEFLATDSGAAAGNNEKWYDVGHPIGYIIDEDGEDEDRDDHDGDWLWQAYAHSEEEEQEN